MRVDLIEVGRRKPLVGVLGALRMLPELATQSLMSGVIGVIGRRGGGFLAAAVAFARRRRSA